MQYVIVYTIALIVNHVYINIVLPIDNYLYSNPYLSVLTQSSNI